jgi:membrane protein implicated in regulation of membrane protease activity
MNRSRAETMEALAGVAAAIVGVIVVSLAPSDLRPVAIVVLVVVYFLAYLLRGFFNRSAR